jgi:hypothetical protein
MARKATELRPIMTRIPEALRRRLERGAARNDRSMNSEIIDRLERSFENEDAAPQIKTLTEDLNALVAKEARTGRVIAGWISDELKKMDFDEAKTKELADLIRAYFGSRTQTP